MIIIEILGGMTSGKTSLSKEFPNIRRWCVKDDFYVPRGVLVEGEMDWDRFNEVIHFMKEDVDKFISKAKKDGEKIG